MNRAERRRAEREQHDKRISGWIRHKSPKELNQGDGWFAELDRVYTDIKGRFVVMIRSVETEWGMIEHVCMKNNENTDIPWVDKQRIKNEVFGKERTAIEVFPAESELVDVAMMYHIWVLPEGLTLPFGLTKG